MVNSLRPVATPQPKSPTRRSSTRSSTSSHHHHHHHQHDPASQHNHVGHAPVVATSDVDTGERPAKRVKVTLKGPKAPKVPATRRAAHDAHNTPKPPTKLTVAEPHGELLQTTNGVRTALNVTEDGLNSNTSGTTTPDPSAPQSTARKTQDRRSLRSHDEGSRLKSELAVYFPNYEHVINDIPQEPDFIDVDTIIHLSNDLYQDAAQPTKAASRVGNRAGENSSRHQHPLSPLKQPVSPSKDKHRFNGAQIIDFSSIEKSVGHHPKDPLTDAVYFKSHRRAERKEKQLRNIEKERAMHEKAQLERLLDGLQGHDWLRVLGVTGVTDLESKKFEAKRDYFVEEVKALLMKFKIWREEERRLKLEKEAAAGAEEEAEAEAEAEEQEEDAANGAEEESDGEPSSSDIDASAARQLQLEASGGGKGKTKQRLPPHPPPPPIIYRPPTPEGPFVSFYSKTHMRAAALGKARHGRNLTAFGQPVVEPEEQEFALPHDYVTEDVLKDNARRRRRKKRQSMLDTSEAAK
ncbi:hypothetical protein MBLNU459_g4339t1 [Dothideomycetes sp. NU459]